ncbi:glycosyltransferase family 2 protein [Alloprevotella tannerae]|uniref:glycosyltransferase family 2 protein n=1 Tax=Alloprevotella tannerae TaxID=76122 RepID=UPI00241D7D52|nr:glycosyltransferase family 2 protein [Alloprevotella tannerae]
MDEIKVTILTASYNRAKLLPTIYKSLQRQTDQCFEWIIVDDGSQDDTALVVKAMQESHKVEGFPITYLHKENGGKHTAINFGVKAAGGILTLVLDSDDELPEDAIHSVWTYFEQIRDDERIGGVCGYMAHRDGRMIGRYVSDDVIDADTRQLQYQYNVDWDMREVFRTSVLREFPYPEIAGEKFCPEDLTLFRIASKYKLRLIPKVIYLADYLPGGLTANIIRIRMKSPVASMMCYAELNQQQIPFIYRLKAAINYFRFRCCVKGSVPSVGFSMRWFWTWPLGFLMHLNDLRRCR